MDEPINASEYSFELDIVIEVYCGRRRFLRIPFWLIVWFPGLQGDSVYSRRVQVHIDRWGNAEGFLDVQVPQHRNRRAPLPRPYGEP